MDDSSGLLKGYCLRAKSESGHVVMNYIKQAANQFDKYVKSVRNDGAKAFATNLLKEFYADHDIEHQVTVPYAHQTNSTAERNIRSIVTMGRSMLYHARLSKSSPESFVLMSTGLETALQSSIPKRFKMSST